MCFDERVERFTLGFPDVIPLLPPDSPMLAVMVFDKYLSPTDLFCNLPLLHVFHIIKLLPVNLPVVQCVLLHIEAPDRPLAKPPCGTLHRHGSGNVRRARLQCQSEE